MTADLGVEEGGGLPPNPAAHELSTAESQAPNEQAGLFGRGLLYVLVFSLQTIAATVVSPILTHLLGPNEFGRLASAIALYQLLSVLGMLGLDQAIVLQRAEDGNSRAARGLLAVSFSLTLTVVGVAWLTSPLWESALGFSGASELLAVTFLWTLPGAAVYVLLSLLLSEDRLKIFTLVSAVSAVGGQIAGVLLVVFVERTALAYAWGGVISYGLALIIALVATRPRLRGLVEFGVARRAFKLGAPLAISAVAAFVLNAGDRIIVQRVLGASEVGRYQVAYTVGYVVVLLMIFVSQAWTPRFAAMRDASQRLLMHKQARDQLYHLLLPMILGITLIAPLALRVFAPPSFRPETLSIVVFLVAVAAFPVAASGATGRELITLRRGRSIAAVAGISATANVVLNIWLVPIFGIAGAAGSTVAAFTLTAALQLLLLRRISPWPNAPWRLWTAIIALCALSAGLTYLPQTTGWNIARFVAALACLPWLIVQLKRARRGPATKPTHNIDDSSVIAPLNGGSTSGEQSTIPLPVETGDSRRDSHGTQ